MRQQLMNAFNEIYILDLHGSTKKRETCPDGSKDENVFDIQQGVAISIFVKEPDNESTAHVYHADLWGVRQRPDGLGGKYGWLGAHNVHNTEWVELSPHTPFYLFIPRDAMLESEFQEGWKVTDVYPFNCVGIVTARDHLSIHLSKERLWETVKDFVGLSVEKAREKYLLRKDTRDWKVHLAQDDLRSEKLTPDKILPILYKPFDLRYTYYTGETRGFLCMPRSEVMWHVIGKHNFALITARSNKSQNMDHFFCTRYITEVKCGERTTGSCFFVLYRYPDPQKPIGDKFDVWPKGRKGRVPNLEKRFVEEFAGKLGLEFISDGKGYLKKTFGPEDIFNYIYAIFHSPAYRERYKEFLKIDFPRVPLTSSRKLFRKLVTLGEELVSLHLLESSKVKEFITRFPERGSDIVEKGYPKYVQKERAVYISREQHFTDVPETVWQFQVGGYKVCHKWLKDRRGRKLSYNELQHYQKIIVALSETIRIMAKIDKAIPSWPIK